MTLDLNRIYIGDCLEVMASWPDGFVQTVVTSPPYWGLRDYGVAGQIGLEATPEAYVARMVEVFRGVKRVLRHDGTIWLNLGDSYAARTGQGEHGDSGLLIDRTKRNSSRWGGGNKHAPNLKPKDLCGIPWRVAFALQADGWYLRSDIIWSKPNPMPESVTDRPTKAHEYLFLLAKSEQYFYDASAIKEPGSSDPESWKTADGWDTLVGNGGHGTFHKEGREKGFKGYKDLPDGQGNIRKARNKQRGHGRRHDGFSDQWDGMKKNEQCSGMRNKRSVWTVATFPFPEAHFATYPPELIKPCILAGSRAGDVVLDPFMGAGTTALVAAELGRQFIGTEMNPDYAAIANRRIANEKAQLKMVI